MGYLSRFEDGLVSWKQGPSGPVQGKRGFSTSFAVEANFVSYFWITKVAVDMEFEEYLRYGWLRCGRTCRGLWKLTTSG